MGGKKEHREVERRGGAGERGWEVVRLLGERRNIGTGEEEHQGKGDAEEVK